MPTALAHLASAVFALLATAGYSADQLRSTDQPTFLAAPLSAAPTITLPPTGGVVSLFGTYSLAVTATGDAPLSYQWKLNGTPIAGATGAAFFANGAGSYTVAVTNPGGTTESVAAIIQPDAPAIALKPFTIPNTTAAGVFPDLRSWNPTAAGAAGIVTTGPDGHFQVGGKRIRFFGVNLTSDNNFPTHAEADLHAQRLARFGFNSVRFHWHDSYWPYYTQNPGSLIIKDSRSSRRFDENARDRLHYFMARCADVGIYSNVNLVVARTFQADDGLGAEVATMPWARQHLLSFFNDKMVELQKEYAAWLLASPNPYRANRSLAQDPAVAIIEILNERGLADGWLHGELPRMPSLYTDELHRRWIAWLRARYTNQTALYAGWYAADKPLGANLLPPVNAATSPDGWSLYRDLPNGAAATTSVTQDYNGAPCRMVDVTSAANYASVQLLHKDMPLTARAVYTISFWAKVEAPGTVHRLKIYAGRAGYADLCEPVAIQGTEWTHYTRTFVMRATEEKSRIGFTLGTALGKTWIADVQLRPGGSVGILPAGITLAAGNIPALLTNDPADYIGMREDWVRFLLDLEKTYWTGMRDYVRSLGFHSVVVGTIVRNSPTNAQAVLQAMDTHDYWNYPTLGDKYKDHTDFSDWTMEHRAMVNSPRENDFVYGALRQVKGYANIATEYEHPAPNLYAGEQEFFFPAYAALQDLDGYWVYSYWTKDRLTIWDHWDSLNSMNKLANITIAAALFRRDVSPALNEYVLAMTPEREVTEIVQRAGHFNMPHAAFLGMPPSVALVSRIRMSIGDNATGLATPPTRPEGPVFVSDTGELRWDATDPTAGFFTINTPRTKAFSGFGSGRRHELGDIAITPGTTRLNWCTVGVTLLEGAGFSGTGTGRALIVATGQYANTEWKWRDATHTGLTTWGKGPFLAEIVSAQVELPVSASRIRAWALSGAGTRVGEVPVTDRAGRAVLTLGNTADTLWYEVQIEADRSAAPVVTEAPPPTATATAGHNVSFASAAIGWPAPSIQWQVSTDSGATWTNLANDSTYSGVATSTLTIAATPSSLNGYRYRSTATNAGGTVASSSTTLTVAPALFARPVGLAMGPAGELYVADETNHTIHAVATATGAVSPRAGATGTLGSADGTATTARFRAPAGLAVDAAGNLYVADSGNGTIRRITPAGFVTTIAGSPSDSGSADGAATTARFSAPADLCLDGAGSLLIADTGNHTIRRLTAAGTVSTLAGAPLVIGTEDGAATHARFNSPAGLALSTNGTLVIADTTNNTLRTLAGTTVATLAGTYGITGTTDGTWLNALFSGPIGLAADSAGNLYVADTQNSSIRKVVLATGTVTTLAGLPGVAGLKDGIGSEAWFNKPRDLALDANGTTLYVADTGNASLRKINLSTRAVSTLALAAAPPQTGTTGGENPPTVENPPTTTGGSTGGGGGGQMGTLFFAVFLALTLVRAVARSRR